MLIYVKCFDWYARFLLSFSFSIYYMNELFKEVVSLQKIIPKLTNLNLKPVLPLNVPIQSNLNILFWR